jgi:hypothetical protein
MPTLITVFVAGVLAATGVVVGLGGSSGAYLCTNGGSSCVAGSTPTPMPTPTPTQINGGGA